MVTGLLETLLLALGRGRLFMRLVVKELRGLLDGTGDAVVTSLSSSNTFWQRDHTSRKPMGNAGHTSPRRSRGQHFLFMTRRVKPFLFSLSFFLLFSFTILSLPNNLIVLHLLLARVY